MKRLLAILLGVALAGPALAASLMPPGKQMYLDSSGNPLSGGKVYTYAAGTSTPLATYSDQAGAIPNANPVVLDARGEASIFWGSAPYKVTLRTSADALVWTQDNLYPPITAAEPLKLYSGGNATTPELVWNDDTNSGLYLIGEDNIGLSLGGTKRWDFAAAGSTLTGTLTVSGAATLQSTLGVTGAATMGPVSVSSITATDAARFVSSITVSGVARFEDDATFLGSTFVPTPVTSMEAATKNYVDGWVDGTSTIVWTANWASEGGGAPGTSVEKASNGLVTLNIDAVASTGAGATLATLAAGYRPAGGVFAVGTDLTVGSLCVFTISQTGDIGIGGSGCSVTNGHVYRGSVSYRATQ